MGLFEEIYEKGEGLLYASGAKTLGGRGPDELSGIYEEGTPRDRKNMALQSLQLAVDSLTEGEIDREEYNAVKEFAVDEVESYYFSEDMGSDFVAPETERTTRSSGLPGDEVVIEEFVESLDYNPSEIDTVVAVAAGGLEPAILTASKLDSELNIVRYSTNDHEDQEVKEVDGDYEGDRVLVIDDNSYTGETLEFVKETLEAKAEEVKTEAVVKGEFLGQIRAIKPHLSRRRWRHK